MSKYHEEKERKRLGIRYSLSNADIQRIKFEATKEGTKQAFKILLGLTCLVLHNSFGFGKKRCEVVCDRMLAMFARMDTDGGITLKQIEEAADKLGNVKAIL